MAVIFARSANLAFSSLSYPVEKQTHDLKKYTDVDAVRMYQTKDLQHNLPGYSFRSVKRFI